MVMMVIYDKPANSFVHSYQNVYNKERCSVKDTFSKSIADLSDGALGVLGTSARAIVTRKSRGALARAHAAIGRIIEQIGTKPKDSAEVQASWA